MTREQFIEDTKKLLELMDKFNSPEVNEFFKNGYPPVTYPEWMLRTAWSSIISSQRSITYYMNQVETFKNEFPIN